MRYATHGGSSRRNFLLSTGAMGVAAGLFGVPAHAQAKKGGRLVVGMTGGAVSDTLDPATFTSSGHACVGFTIGNCLTEIEKDSELVANWPKAGKAQPTPRPGSSTCARA